MLYCATQHIPLRGISGNEGHSVVPCGSFRTTWTASASSAWPGEHGRDHSLGQLGQTPVDPAQAERHASEFAQQGRPPRERSQQGPDMQAAVAVQHPAQLRQRVFYRVENHTTMYKWHLALRSPGRQRVGFHPYGQRPARRGGTLGCRCSDDVVGGQRRAAVNARQLRRPRRRRWRPKRLRQNPTHVFQ